MSKAEPDGLVMKEIGKILSAYGDVDVIVSALSPAYVHILVTRSNREIKYNYLPALIDEDLGKAEIFNDLPAVLFSKGEVTSGVLGSKGHI